MFFLGHLFLTAEKDVELVRKRGRGEVIWAMPERKHSFFREVFPKMLEPVPVPVSVLQLSGPVPVPNTDAPPSLDQRILFNHLHS